MAEAVYSLSVPPLVSIQAALDCIHDNNPAVLTAPIYRRRYDRQTLDRLRDRLIEIGARCRGQIDWGRQDWVELLGYRLAYRSFLNQLTGIVVAVSRATYPPTDIKDRSAPVRPAGAAEPRFRLVARNLMVESRPLLAPIRPAHSISPGSSIAMETAEYKNASEAAIHAAITEVFASVEKGAKPPNINELASLVKLRLNACGSNASATQIRKIGSKLEFKKLRGKVGVTRMRRT